MSSKVMSSSEATSSNATPPRHIITTPHPDEKLESCIFPPSPSQDVHTHYTEVDVSHCQHIPLFRPVCSRPKPHETAEVARAIRRDGEYYYFTMSLLRELAHRAAVLLGFPANCAQPACRRARWCVSDRHEFDWGFPGPWMPPCATTYRMVDQIRSLIRMAVEDGKREAREIREGRAPEPQNDGPRKSRKGKRRGGDDQGPML